MKITQEQLTKMIGEELNSLYKEGQGHGEMSDKMRELEDKIEVLENENTKLRIAHCNLRDEFLDLGGDPEQLELFDKENPSQLKIYESPDGGKTVYERNFGEHGNRKIIK